MDHLHFHFQVFDKCDVEGVVVFVVVFGAPRPLSPPQTTSLQQNTPNNSHHKIIEKRQNMPIPTDTKAPKAPKTPLEKENAVRLIVVLEHASLETVKIGKSKEGKYALLNCDDHKTSLRKNGRDISEARPDITHQVKMK